ncbi:response regulator transcription factor [Streptomyces acidiscabies]|uniref:Sensory transduction protein RegX3 n=1 Tax=Streptomyces acidiscabies TaxID=42234 RepID=A0A0L0JD41_9ACTN|nr:response regulator transcription factor [Streptomyces acidiscabies]MBP5942301.1 response regulator transcription factor [Streptomyces sp. LBUM 1476]KND23647.1 transcriptional regulator [Streptomyces acidiscabies]MBZ3913851.1 response regulator transcription factor [Streptomyces acidiscabies]MDX2964478.1 response regulator transcription factor [Streptomyces acidiscabies]MDX3022058.1 response regulator transcription factor [Streptomyces acidiscabies]
MTQISSEFLREPLISTRPGTGGWRILIVEGDAGDACALEEGLRRHGHEVAAVDRGAQALAAYENVDLVLMELELPDLDGLEVCKAIRTVSCVPLIVVTARGSELDRVLGLQAGADDYLVKPYGFRELMARIDAVMRRVRSRRSPSRAIDHGPLHIDVGSREVCLDGHGVELTRKEFDLLCLLASHPDTVISRKRLLQQVWGDSWSRRTVDTHVSSLRRKLGGNGWVVTVRGVGFRLGHA